MRLDGRFARFFHANSSSSGWSTFRQFSEQARRESESDHAVEVIGRLPEPARGAAPSGFHQVGPAALAGHMSNDVCKSAQDPDRVSFRRRAQMGMAMLFLCGVFVDGSTMPVRDLVCAALCSWGNDEEEDYPHVAKLRIGLRDVMVS